MEVGDWGAWSPRVGAYGAGELRFVGVHGIEGLGYIEL